MSLVHEMIGTLANILIVAAFAVRGEKKIRTISLFGSAVSAVYNFLLHSTNFFILNCLIICVHLYKLMFCKLEWKKFVGQATFYFLKIVGGGERFVWQNTKDTFWNDKRHWNSGIHINDFDSKFVFMT